MSCEKNLKIFPKKNQCRPFKEGYLFFDKKIFDDKRLSPKLSGIYLTILSYEDYETGIVFLDDIPKNLIKKRDLNLSVSLLIDYGYLKETFLEKHYEVVE